MGNKQWKIKGKERKWMGEYWGFPDITPPSRHGDPTWRWSRWNGMRWSWYVVVPLGSGDGTSQWHPWCGRDCSVVPSCYAQRRSLSTWLGTPYAAIASDCRGLLTPGDHTFFLGKNRFGNMSCVSNMFFLKKNEKFLSRKNLIKMNYFIHIFLLWKMVYFTEKKYVKNDIFSINFSTGKIWKNVTFLCKKKRKKNIIFFHVGKNVQISTQWLSFSDMEKYYIFFTFFLHKNVTFFPNFTCIKINGKYIIFHIFFFQ